MLEIERPHSSRADVDLVGTAPSDQHEAVGKDSGKTNHVERWNNTLRQRLGQFVRRTLSFSKSWELHVVRLRLFVHRYNFEIGKSIRY